MLLPKPLQWLMTLVEKVIHIPKMNCYSLIFVWDGISSFLFMHFPEHLETVYPSPGNLRGNFSRKTPGEVHVIWIWIFHLLEQAVGLYLGPPVHLCPEALHHPRWSTKAGRDLACAFQHAWGISSKELAATHAKEMAFISWIRMVCYIRSAILFSLLRNETAVSFRSSRRTGSNLTS